MTDDDFAAHVIKMTKTLKEEVQGMDAHDASLLMYEVNYSVNRWISRGFK